MAIHRLEIETRPDLTDALATRTCARLDAWLQVAPTQLRTRRVFHLDVRGEDGVELSAGEIQEVLEALVDPVAEVGSVGMLPDPNFDAGVALAVGFRPGVTDTVAATVRVAIADTLGRVIAGRVYSSTLYLFDGLTEAQVQHAADKLLHNPLIERASISAFPRALDLDVPSAGSPSTPAVQRVALRDAEDEALMRLSKDGMLALSLEEMRAIQSHFSTLDRDPNDAELECLAQTWSEHCKHKIFASSISYQDPEGTRTRLDEGLFKTYVRGATEAVERDRAEAGIDDEGASFLVSVFHDNAGVVRFTEEDHLAYKVETHNSPSALDPYGGAMTGIVGVNRDSFGTGRGADLLTNVWGYCLGDPRHEGALPKGLMHPRRIRDGVHAGVIDGGNHSGVPYSRGFELFDDRYAGKPLVYCGTVSVMPAVCAGVPTHEKPVSVGDAIVMLGGRIGKDGIHGATFSSVELDEDSPVQAVQIGDPITQRMMFDMLAEARDRGLYSGMTDNGAGGLSSSVGEMAEFTNGARIDLAKAPVKYPGLAPWEILISEAQERMTVAVPLEHLDTFMALAERREVEASVLGEFTDTGRFEVCYGDAMVCDLELEFLHEGVPLPTLQARWSPPARESTDQATLAALVSEQGIAATMGRLMARPSIASQEDRARAYDHEVKGLSVIKPWCGHRSDVPSTASVMRARHGRSEGVVLGEGIHPFYSDIDAHAMGHACVDEALRRVLCAGARIDRVSALDNFCWPDPIESDKNPDGAHKLAQLVRCCEALYESCVAHGVPLISGKDSMKNDAYLDGVRISIPPTLLVSVMGQMEDVGAALSLEPRAEGDLVFVLGHTRAEFGGSEMCRMLDRWSDTVPRTDARACAASYRAFAALRDRGVVKSAHVVGRGGLAVALGHMTMASPFGICVERVPGGLEPPLAWFSESTGRIVFTVSESDAAEAAALVDAHGGECLGSVEGSEEGGHLRFLHDTDGFGVGADALRASFKEGLHGL